MNAEDFTDVGIFVLAAPLEDRPALESWLMAKGVHSVSFISVHRPVSEYVHRARAVPKAMFLLWQDYQMRPADLTFVTDENFGLARASNLGTEFLVKRANPTLELELHPDTVAADNGPAAPEPDQISHLLYARPDDAAVGTTASTYAVVPDDISANDITMLICVRAHEKNPWVLDRLSVLGSLYTPCPRIRIVDFGSDVEYSEQIEKLCAAQGIEYAYVDDRGVFSLAKARNTGAMLCETDLIFFSDIDFVFPSDFFADLARTSAALAARSRIDVVLMCAAVHVSETASAEYFAMPGLQERSNFLRQIGYHSIYDKFGGSVQYVAPYSNVFLINRQLFSLSGGYDENFRGHGSEDFEYILRLNSYTNHFPQPPKPMDDTGGPLKADFFKNKPYSGFRALSSLTALPGELSGLKAYHLYHPTPAESWRESNDWRRVKMKELMGHYVGTPQNLLTVDHIPRPKKALCICLQPEHWGYFAPLRLAGYEIVPVYDGAVKYIEAATQMITAGEIDAFVIFNPYMQSHQKFRGLFMLARQHCRTIVIERGALPGTIYYADDVAYTSAQYSADAFADYQPDVAERTAAVNYMAQLRLGASALESGAPYGFTMRRYSPLAVIEQPIVFIPMQLEEDMAVTMFLRDSQRYIDFAASINDVAARNPDVIFMVKPHPLSKGGVPLTGANIIIAERDDNIHALIELSSAVIAYNSGVSLLAMAHQKPVWTIGNAYFNRGGAGQVADSLSDAVDSFTAGTTSVDGEAITRVYAWLLSRMYSNFTATDNIREFQTRKAHGYKDIVVTSLALDGTRYGAGRVRSSANGVFSTFGSGLLNFTPPPGSDG